MADGTQILRRIEKGGGQAADLLLPLTCEDLRNLSVQDKSGEALRAPVVTHKPRIQPASGCRPGPALGQPAQLLCRGSGTDAVDFRRWCPSQRIRTC
jgi:hypothetical protein